ncbi:B3/4 domain-containing protein [Olsenella sp. HMSC062G07]|uniref:B3/B4 domain-containing protein n=1 Tax=Olsenella sp. HMSC062G07 TaxID=1739330 RepID=UPI0008A3A62A|nr:phenylalanine--tRNA ligase beta subunit-related protein [Olsenella sp. HMSC062G07]OFK22405.1 hypothetical protein HMPREF2826_01260 [Olsenella sp. HMSC062G07]
MKKFVVEDSFWDIFPEVQIGIVCANGLKPTDAISPANVAKAARLLDHANEAARQWISSSVISQNEVVAVWREAYKKFKTKKGARVSVENLIKRVMRGNPVGHINPVVDVSNVISLTYAMPIGAENIDAVEGTFRLAVTEGGDEFLPIGEDQNDPTLPGEIAYLDDAGAVCRCWNWRDCQRTAVGDDTPHCMFIMECVDPSRTGDLRAAIDEMGQLAEDILGGHVTNKDFLTRAHPSCELV